MGYIFVIWFFSPFIYDFFIPTRDKLDIFFFFHKRFTDNTSSTLVLHHLIDIHRRIFLKHPRYRRHKLTGFVRSHDVLLSLHGDWFSDGTITLGDWKNAVKIFYQIFMDISSRETERVRKTITYCINFCFCIYFFFQIFIIQVIHISGHICQINSEMWVKLVQVDIFRANFTD